MIGLPKRRALAVTERVMTRLLYPTSHPSENALRDAVSGRTVLLTGASYGIGKATARKLAAAGATVLLVARTRERLEELAAEIARDGGTAYVYPTDLTDMDAVARLAADILDRHGHVDVVINNAGKSIRRAIDESYDRFHDFQRTIDVNYLGPVRLFLGLLPSMRARQHGHIVNISTWGVRVPPAPRWAAYTASKAAFDVWLRSVAAEAAADGVTTTNIYMPLVRTRMSAPTAYLKQIPGLSAAQAADLVCHAIVAKPRDIAPWWSTPLQAYTDLARGRAAAFMERGYKRSRQTPHPEGNASVHSLDESRANRA